MHHSPDQLDALWGALKSADPAQRSKVLQRYSNPSMAGALPQVVCDDEHAQVLSIPTPDHPGRHVYVRRPGGTWAEQH
ncbi:hypothetical protein [Ramlibacter alkalitolerans]|uniref:Uncharacterized protein n=1 Tax=Ramlibacter alkalitolerans TaxID=2039631 RepID=A0ABS1JT77_9BURK|nr:hypothetical protein [Ramlibacter alkalitolerans]MBL0426780.1 hypothetical protein [Ramlibacter alkalitolerans]